jgi:phytanoyl-CoA hydroxylase
MALIGKEQLQQFEEQGYIIFTDLFTAEETDVLRESIDKLDYASEQSLKQLGQQGISIPNQINFTTFLHKKDDKIEQFIADDRFVEITTTLLGPDTQLFWDQSVYKRPEANRDFPWHQDTGYIPIEPEFYLTCWLALEDATIENGCIWVLPETHKLGLLEHKDTEIGKQCYFGEDPGIPVPMKKGSMVAFHSLLFHRSTPNRSQASRKAFIAQYSPIGAKNPETGEVYHNGPIIAKDGKGVHSVQL